jgi:hypothetical protein
VPLLSQRRLGRAQKQRKSFSWVWLPLPFSFHFKLGETAVTPITVLARRSTFLEEGTGILALKSHARNPYPRSAEADRAAALMDDRLMNDDWPDEETDNPLLADENG